MPSTGNGNAQHMRFATLEARIDRVPDATIRKKWKKLPASSHGAASDALSVARQQARSRRGKGKHHQTAEDCVDAMLDRLHNRLSLIPYPPATDESHFDHEANLNRASKLESQLADNQNAIRLLEKQIVVEKEHLAAEEQVLKSLERNAASEESVRRQRFPNLHPVAKEISENGNDNIDLSVLQQKLPSMHIKMPLLNEDPDLLRTLEQLENHLTSISHNMASILPVGRGVEQARNELLVAINK